MFHHATDTSGKALVALNADIKFRCYFKMIQQNPPTTTLPDDVLELMGRVVELVDLLYWVPVPTKVSMGCTIQAEKAPLKPGRAGRSSQLQYTEAASDEEGRMEGSPTPSKVCKMSKRHRRFAWPADEDSEMRKAYGTALMCGHDIDYDPALFEDAFPIDDPAHLYSDNAAMETWNQGVTEGLSE
ncbi:uncharacterized protein LACBIDRAFT_300062 [Laccaria bicolor S238N-H82]|uniref:Predicted protein n=1 Tax=Laccaria bicolor (strain S238N-H82 / ATCC MYA-4686) TaxID=486041 RepID=B0DFY4_LACBS|nr:uncharacterized protein LACBIDRAFT_300062 [Laccaria bicolor S238N-H82]EDR06424.1 predicted protein [Laccaria bicolor S238N-H82]|eukprot:XP_001882796.1 predicted protein [Laccaria bicolor S238N-H82]